MIDPHLEIYSDEETPSTNIKDREDADSEKCEISSDDWSPSETNKSKRKWKNWSLEEKHKTLLYFSKTVEKNQIPGKVECENYLRMNPSIKRKWTNVKDLVRNESKKIV